MFDRLEGLSRQISETADDSGMVIFDGVPDMETVPVAIWSGDWRSFIDLARRAGVTLLYLEIVKYEPETLIDGTVYERMPSRFLPDEDDQLESVTEEGIWLRARLQEAIAPWDGHRERPMVLTCVWFKDGVAHQWHEEAEWAADQQDAFQRALDDSNQIAKRERLLRTQEAAEKLHAYAYMLAIHPKFPEAKSEEKREYMAERMFEDELRAQPASYQIFPHAIARRAALIYWWDVEPTDRVALEERARELYQNGESIKNIAAILNISDARVRAALKR